MDDIINTYKSWLLILNGKQGSGKSHLISWLMREIYNSKHPFDYGIVFCNTLFEDSFDYLPKKYLYENFDEDVLKNLMKLQKDNVKKGIKKRAFVIFDDCLDDKKQFSNETIRKLTTQLRHYNISVIFSTQYPHLIPPRVRSNAMYSVFFDIGAGRRELESTYNCYGNRFSSFHDFKQFYFENIKDHKFIMYDKNQNKYIVYRAPEEIPSFKYKYNKKISK